VVTQGQGCLRFSETSGSGGQELSQQMSFDIPRLTLSLGGQQENSFGNFHRRALLLTSKGGAGQNFV
jgi:hypothetical protein